MSKRSAAPRKKQLAIIAAVFGVLALGAGAYYAYQWYQSQQPSQAVVTPEMKKEASELGVMGDEDLAARYVAALKAGDTAKARKLFADRVAKEPDVAKKLALYTQNIQLALSSQKPDEAMFAAEQAIAVRADDTTYSQAATVAVAKHDTQTQIGYLEKAVAAVSASDRVNKEQALQYYQGQIESAKQQQDTVYEVKQ